MVRYLPITFGNRFGVVAILEGSTGNRYVELTNSRG